MVQKEVMKKTKTYGLIALLLAIVLVAMIYAYGNKGISPAVQQQSRKLNQTLGTQTSLKTFASYDELKNYLNQSSSSNLDSRYMYTGTFNGMATCSSASTLRRHLQLHKALQMIIQQLTSKLQASMKQTP